MRASETPLVGAAKWRGHLASDALWFGGDFPEPGRLDAFGPDNGQTLRSSVFGPAPPLLLYNRRLDGRPVISRLWIFSKLLDYRWSEVWLQNTLSIIDEAWEGCGKIFPKNKPLWSGTYYIYIVVFEYIRIGTSLFGTRDNGRLSKR